MTAGGLFFPHQLHLLIFSLLLTSNKRIYWDMKIVSIPLAQVLLGSGLC